MEGSRGPWERGSRRSPKDVGGHGSGSSVLDVSSCVSPTGLCTWRELLSAHCAMFWEGMVFKFSCLPAMDLDCVVSTHAKVFAVSAGLMLT